MDWRAGLQDSQFILGPVLGATGTLRGLAPFGDADDALCTQVLEQAAHFVQAEIAPLSRIGDEAGCSFADGRVTTPPGFAAAYRRFVDAGWPALAAGPEEGGQGLPWVLEGVLYEMLAGANHGWTMAPGLLDGAAECIRHHGSEALRADYLPHLVSGRWLATMCLTESQAGSDLGLVRTRGVPQPDGSVRVSGTKIFISGGEHDLTDNIVHLVLGRLPDAPAGPKGLSLFLVPRQLPGGARNRVVCERIEEKMGLHGSPTCVMRFDDATGWLVGEPHRGLAAMFVMMNAARLHVALQGLGLLDAALQKAQAYAHERRQMRAPRAAGEAPADGPDPIVRHPAVRRTLDVQRAWVDGGRFLAYRTGVLLDVARHAPDARAREAAEAWCSLVTPVLKALLTRQAFEGASDCLQIFGGHGYVREWGIEQIVRDARVTLIYEGTNEIQAIDLLVRKVLPDGGARLASALNALRRELDAGRSADADALRRFAELRYLTAQLVEAARLDPKLAHELADDYLRVVGLALMAAAWARIAGTPGADTPRWQAPAAAFARHVLPEFDMRLGMIQSRCRAAMQPVAA